jgi:hypothetical protein
MKLGRLFWGTLFLVVGLLLLLDKLNVLFIHWHSMWRLWPLVLVFWGIAVLLKNVILKSIAIVLSGLTLGVIIFGLVSFAFLDDDIPWPDEPFVQEFVEPYDSTIEKASLTVDAGAGTLSIENTSTALFSAFTSSSLGHYRLNKFRLGDAEDLSLSLESDRIRWRDRKLRNRAEVHLHTNPVWDLDLNVGAAKVDAELSQHKTESIRVDAGAATVRLRLGANVEESRVNVDAGVSSINISVPSSAGCQIRYNGGLASKRFYEFEKIDSETYRSENFAWSPRKIYINIDVGVSSVKVNRY